LKQSSPVLPLWADTVKPKITSMFKRLFASSLSVVLRHPLDGDIQVCPPRSSRGAPPPRGGLAGWITSTTPTAPGGACPRSESGAPEADNPLTQARHDFIETLADIRTQQAGDLLRRIRVARSLRELWFLRTEVFNLVAHHRDQTVAAQRMALLGTHFPRQVARTAAGRPRLLKS